MAAPREVETVLAGLDPEGGGVPDPWSVRECGRGLWVVHTGVGKTNAAGAVARALEGERYSAVLSLGLGGALPGERPPCVGEVVLAECCVLADDGLETAEGFRSQSALGFPATSTHGEQFPCDRVLCGALESVSSCIGRCATVSTCSGTDERAATIAARTGAVVEDMESAAVGLVASRLGVPFGCVRVVSNRAGDREHQGWDLECAFGVLTKITAAL